MDRNETIGVKTTLADGRVEQTIGGLAKRVVDVAAHHQEAAVRAALTQLGWTPPEESEELRRDAERYRFIAADHSLAWEAELDAAIDSARGAIDADRKEGV